MWGNLPQPLWLDFFRLTFPHILNQNLNLSIFTGRTTEKEERRTEITCALLSPTNSPLQYIVPPPAFQQYLTKLWSMLRHTIFHHWVPLEEFLPCVAQNSFSVNSPCSYFSISVTRTGHRTTAMWWNCLWKTSVRRSNPLQSQQKTPKESWSMHRHPHKEADTYVEGGSQPQLVPWPQPKSQLPPHPVAVTTGSSLRLMKPPRPG